MSQAEWAADKGADRRDIILRSGLLFSSGTGIFDGTSVNILSR